MQIIYDEVIQKLSFHIQNTKKQSVIFPEDRYCEKNLFSFKYINFCSFVFVMVLFSLPVSDEPPHEKWPTNIQFHNISQSRNGVSKVYVCPTLHNFPCSFHASNWQKTVNFNNQVVSYHLLLYVYCAFFLQATFLISRVEKAI